MPILRYVRTTRALDALTVLRLDEALLRGAGGGWLAVHDGVADAAVVLGISGKPADLVHEPAAAAAAVPLIRRFSGGGTVVVDGGSVLVTLAGDDGHLPPAVAGRGPRPLMAWTADVWAPLFGGGGRGYRLAEHDYALGDRKFGGNAQALSRGRWLHHTSFLWSYERERMALLKPPPKAPPYRAGRAHDDFLVPLQSVFGEGGREEMVDGFAACARAAGFDLVPTPVEEALALLEGDYHRSTVVVGEGE